MFTALAMKSHETFERKEYIGMAFTKNSLLCANCFLSSANSGINMLASIIGVNTRSIFDTQCRGRRFRQFLAPRGSRTSFITMFILNREISGHSTSKQDGSGLGKCSSSVRTRRVFRGQRCFGCGNAVQSLYRFIQRYCPLFEASLAKRCCPWKATEQSPFSILRHGEE